MRRIVTAVLAIAMLCGVASFQSTSIVSVSEAQDGKGEKKSGKGPSSSGGMTSGG